MKQNWSHKKKVATKKKIIEMINKKCTLKEIMDEVELAKSTIFRYLEELPKNCDFAYLIEVDENHEKEVLNYLKSVEWDKTKKSIKEAVSENISYDEIKLILLRNKIKKQTDFPSAFYIAVQISFSISR